LRIGTDISYTADPLSSHRHIACFLRVCEPVNCKLAISMVTPLCSHCSHCSVLESPHPSPCLIGPFARMAFPGDRERNLSVKRGVSMASSGAPLPCASARKLESWGQHRPSYWSSCRIRSLGFEGTRTKKISHFLADRMSIFTRHGYMQHTINKS
jgi:hypothetical protein